MGVMARGPAGFNAAPEPAACGRTVSVRFGPGPVDEAGGGSPRRGTTAGMRPRKLTDLLPPHPLDRPSRHPLLPLPGVELYS